MTGDFKVRYTDAARDDLIGLFEFQLARAQTAEDFAAAQSAIDNLTSFVEGHLGRTPFIYRQLGQSPFLRESIVPFRGAVLPVPVSSLPRMEPGRSASMRQADSAAQVGRCVPVRPGRTT